MMYRLIIRRVTMMIYFRWMLQRKILIQRSAKHHIDKLYSPADAKHGFIIAHSCFQDNRFHRIPFFTGRNKIFDRSFIIETGRYIVTACEKETITGISQLLQILRILGKRKDHGNGSSLTESIHVAR